MAALGHTVNVDGGADYTSLNALEAAQNQDLTDGGGDTYTATCASTGGTPTADTTMVIFNGFITAAANYVEIKAAVGDEVVKTGWDTSKYRLEVSNPSLGSLTVADNYVRVINLQIRMSYVDDAGQAAIYAYSVPAGGADLRISGCYIEADTNAASNSDGININDVDFVTVSIWNNIVFKGDRIGMYFPGVGTANVFNNVVYGWAQGITGGGTSNVIMKNNAVFKNGDDFNDATSGTWTVDYNASDDNDGTNNVAGNEADADWTTDFTGAATGDFTILTGSPLKDGGVNDPGSGLFSVDIEGDTYVIDSWPVGVDQFMAVGGAALSLPIAMAYYNRIRRTSGD